MKNVCGGGREELVKVIKNNNNKNDYNLLALTVSQVPALS